MATNVPFGPDTPISIKVVFEKNSARKFKIPFSELGPDVLPAKLRSLLEIPESIPVQFQRWSDSGSSYEVLDPSDTAVFKKLARAARAKLKLRIKVVIPPTANNHALYTLPNHHPALASEVTLASANDICNALPSPQILSPLRLSTTSDGLMGFPTMPSATLLNVATVGSSTQSATNPYSLRTCHSDYMIEPFGQCDLAVRPKVESVVPPTYPWSVYCNICDTPMANEHYHCNICDDGDYDLCQTCVDAGRHCPGDGHWLIKRLVKNGHVINSTTERVSPKLKLNEPSDMPGAFTEEKKMENEDAEEEQRDSPTRTCNACVNEFSENHFVTCEDCEDYDLCMSCHENNKHGHHPGHTFMPATTETLMTSAAELLCAPGRNVRHSAVCDGCDKTIFGVRHKCLNCPDWDFCSDCVKSARHIHPTHRFATIYDPIPEPHMGHARHIGIYCDGPLCKDKREYITGIRYKCAICHDTDFCGNCEAIPRNRHNRTHPLIKFKTPVRNVSVTTMGEDKNGAPMATMGDQSTKNNAPSPVRTVVDVKPSEPAAVPTLASATILKTEKIQIKDLLAEPIEEKIRVEDLKPTPVQIPSQELNAHYVRDTVKDGSIMTPSQRFVQVWTLRNPGPHAWPAGCVVSFVGGDRMFNIDDNHPSSEADLADAQRSNVVGRVVEVGEEIAFRVMMKAPKHEGTAISYWRLKAADGVVFGHRLWCHIKVVAAPQMVFSSPQPAAAFPAPVTVPTVDRTESVGRPKLQEEFLQLLLRSQEARRLQEQKTAEIAKLHADFEEKKKAELEQKESRDQILRDLQNEIRTTHLQNQLRLVAARRIAIAAAKDATSQEQKEDADAAELAATTPSVKVEPAPAFVEDEDGKTESTAMIFPKLEKESPASSMHESTKTAPESATTPEMKKVEPFSVTSPSTKTETETEIFEDAESVDLLGSSDDDDFLTDEEYDILDASDEEHVA